MVYLRALVVDIWDLSRPWPNLVVLVTTQLLEARGLISYYTRVPRQPDHHSNKLLRDISYWIMQLVDHSACEKIAEVSMEMGIAENVEPRRLEALSITARIFQRITLSKTNMRRLYPQ